MAEKQLVIAVDDPILPLRNLICITIAGVAYELKLPIETHTGETFLQGPFVHISYPEDFQIQEWKEDFRERLNARPIDIMLKRRIMRMLFATSVEEP